MTHLLDTNIILRWSDTLAFEHNSCVRALELLTERDNVICTCAQVLIEYYVVATRPVQVNGLGYSQLEARQVVAEAKNSFPCLPEPPDMADRWLQLVTECGVSGRQAHDARIAALMIAHGVTHILTLDPDDFARYPGVTTVTPASIFAE